MAIAIYARKSIERENSISCETQIQYCQARILPHEKDEKIIYYKDNGFSGGNMKRDAFLEMMQNIEKGQISKVIIYRLDRISRSLADFVTILNILKDHHVALVSTQESFDTDSPYGDMIVKILMVFAEFERNTIIARVAQSYAHRSELGLYMGGRRPYGFDLAETEVQHIKTKKLSPREVEIKQVQYIFETYAVPQITLGNLQKKLIENHMLPPKGQNWSTGKLSTILKNPIYVKADSVIYDYFAARNTNIISAPTAFDGIHGLQLYGITKHNHDSTDWSDIKAVIMPHEGVIDSEIFLKCQQKLKKNKQIRNAVSNKSSWLGGKVFCKKCGRTMTTIKGSTGRGEMRIYFICTGKSHLKTCTGIQKTVYAESLEDMVYLAISEKLLLLEEDFPIKQKTSNPLINHLRNRINALKKEENKIADAFVKEAVNGDLIQILNDKATKIKAESAAITEKIHMLSENTEPSQRHISLASKWKNASFEEKRGVCSVLIYKIVMDETGDVEIIWNI